MAPSIYTTKENLSIELISFAKPNSAQVLEELTLSLDFQVSQQSIACFADQALINAVWGFLDGLDTS